MRLVRPIALLALVLAPAVAQAQPAAPATPAAPRTADGAKAPTPPAAPAVPDAQAHAEVLAFGREVARLVYAKQLDSIMLLADSTTGDPAEVRERIRVALGQLNEQVGTETRVIAERVMIVNGRAQYWRDAEYTGVPVPLILRVITGAPGKWRGFTISTEETLPPATELKPE